MAKMILLGFLSPQGLTKQGGQEEDAAQIPFSVTRVLCGRWAGGGGGSQKIPPSCLAKDCPYSTHPRFAGVQECWELVTCGTPVSGKSAFCLTSSQALARGWSAVKDTEADVVASGGLRG